MILNLLNASSITAITHKIALTMSTVIVMSTIQSSEIERAASQQTYVFVAYVILLVLTLVGTVFLYRAGNAYQQAVKADADARIAEAGTKAAEANAQAAKANEGLSKSNQEIARLTKEAEEARTERAEADKQIAIAKADAARAKEGIANAEAVSAKAAVEVARLQAVVANAETKRAEAERALLELQERIKDRHLSSEQKATLLTFLRSTEVKGKVDLFCAAGASNEPCNFAAEIADVFRQAGWEIGKPDRGLVIGGNPLLLKLHSPDTVPPHAVVFQQALAAIGLIAEAEVDPSRPAGSIQFLVNVKR